ncbi:MAG: DNA helicase PcrA [Actinobacteria bacterium]|nr:DNA helicase PcrA [Actinomycetota bacterium]
MELEKHLNPQQLKAVKETENPLLVIAGAGSGKTRVLTYKIAYLIGEKNVDPFSILAITFTNRAANEMKRRVVQLVGKVGELMWVSTFHSFCARILRYEIHNLGIPRNFVIYDSEDQLSLISSCLKELNLDIKRFSPRAIQAVISDAKNKLIDHQTFSKKAYDYFEKVVAEVYPLYQEKLLKASALDFDDLLMFTVDLLRLFPEVRQKYQEKFKYILVDEFQDTNLAQNEIVLILSEKHRRVCVVGDDDQSIYSWRGAEIRNIISFDMKFPDTVVIKLEQNYRSTQNILNAANAIIKNNENRKEKKLWTSNPSGEPVSKYVAVDEKDEVRFVVEKIREYMEKRGKRYRDFAIFYRTNAQSRAVEEFLIRENIPYKIYGGLRFYDRKEIKDMLAYLRLISNPKDVISLTRIVNVPSRKIGEKTISIIEKFAQKNRMTFCEAFYRHTEIPGLSEEAKKRIDKFIDLISELRNYAMEHGVDELLQEIWKRTGYMRELELENTIDAMNRIENLKELLTVTKEYENRVFFESHPNNKDEIGKLGRESERMDDASSGGDEIRGSGLAMLNRFLEEVSLLTDIDNYDESSDSLVLMTLHNAKGLEFPVVFIIGMEEGIFPHSRSMNSIEELEEERRLCYVGITRAKEKVFLTSALSHSIYGDTTFRTVSRFIKEIPENLLLDENKVSTLNKKKKDATGYPEKDRSGRIKEIEDYSEGDLIEHKIWGTGEVVKVKNLGSDCEIDVIFDSVGLKHLLVSYAPIRCKRKSQA